MNILEITVDQLPCWTINVGKTRFTREPFATREEAEAHRLLILAEHGEAVPDAAERVTVVEYTEADLRRDLAAELIRDLRLALAVLERLSVETLREALRG